MYLEMVALLPFLSVWSSSQSDLSQMFKLAFGLFRKGRSRREGSPSDLNLRLELVKLRGRRRNTLDLETLQVTKLFV